MSARTIDGKACAAATRAALGAAIASRRERGLRVPGLVTILVGEDPASKVYVGTKRRQSTELGMHSESVELPADCSQAELLETIERYNANPQIDGILVQLPLPAHLDAEIAIAALDPAKDVDGLHPLNQGALLTGRPGMRPCTPLGCMELIDGTGVDVAGSHAVVIGRSVLVGKPVALLLLERHATVTMCHSRTRDLREQVAAADIVVAAVGRAQMVKGDWIKPGAVVIDVGMNRVDGNLVGDVDFAAAAERAAHITPVPGGVGPMTVAMLLRNTFAACETADAKASGR